MAKRLIRNIAPYIDLYRDDRTGIAIVEDGTSGTGASPHPNIDATGSIRGMKKLGNWGKDDEVVRSFGFLFNISRYSIDPNDELDEIAARACRCGGNHGLYS